MPISLPRSKRLTKPSRPSTQQNSAFAKKKRAESREIAKRVHKRSHSNRLEHMLRRLGNKNPAALAVKSLSPLEMEYLAIAQRPDKRYQIIVSGSNRTLTNIVFETIEHCAEAAAELEQKFDMRRFLNSPIGETQESVVAIVRRHQWRETVQRSFTTA